MKYMFVAMKLETNPRVDIGNLAKIELKLPDDCVGIMYAFESIEAAQKYYGDDVKITIIEEDGE